MWRADNYIAGVSFVRGHRTLQDEVDRTGIEELYSSLCEGLKAAAGTLPNSLGVFDYMWSIFDSYVNPTNDPNVQPLVKGLDADDFSVDKFFGLQDPTSLDDVQAGPDFEEDLRTNERLRLRVESRNLMAKPQRLTRSTQVCFEYEPTILSDVPPTDNPALLITLDLTVELVKIHLPRDSSRLCRIQHLWISLDTCRPQRTRDQKIKDGLVKKILRRKT
ncbi:hypothetical protein R1flu_015975 [Riccia fluitans]|uniref:Uncharacterized protein n=1 Tax=Riccia fluitans TaxID=41844 RepID=A0ABD1YLI8_9MARC